MRGNSLSFLKPPVFVKTILLSCALFASMFFNSCKQLTSFDPNVDGVRVAVSDAFSAPADVKATHGLKQKISLEWLPVSGARYYDIYSAESATAEFKKIGETDKNSFDDRVGAGRTLYYRVCAVKSDGTQSASSATVKGTSLAAPVISGGDVSDTSATISWFMENARAVDGTDNYEGSLIFVVHWQQKNGGAPNEKTLAAAKDFTNSFYVWTIDNLSGASDYEFWIEAYLSGDQTNNESSPKVDKKTLTSYTPLAPVFTAAQGESAQGVWLFITLPENVMVQTETKESPNEKKDEPYPLKFEISRAIGEIGEDDSGASWEVVCQYLYYNGTTTPPAETEYTESPYNAGDEIRWFDESANLVGGEKYTYRIRSFVDAGYSKVVCPEGKEYNGNAGTPENKASKALGWKSAHPSFKVNYSSEGSRTLSADKAKVLSYEFGFGAEWKDLGKAGEYKFAIKQNRKPYEENYSGSGEDTWLKNAGGGDFFGTIEEIASYAVKFGSAENGLSGAEIGVYSYTLYIVLKDAGIGEVEGKTLDSVKAADEIVVTDAVKLPKAEFKAKGGYKDKVVLEITYEPDVTYKVIRTRLDTNPQVATPEFEIPVPENHGETFPYDDKVEGNGRYSYILKAVDKGSKAFSLSPAQEAETLGTPKVSFVKDRLCYDSVTISFDGVLAAKKYTVTLGAAGGFGGGNEFSFDAGFAGTVGNAEVALAANKYTVTINKPEGYDDARLAGKTADATVTARSDVDNAPSAPEPVNVVGPACLEAKVSENATENSITLEWKAMPGAKGYLIRRVMYEKADSENVAEDSDVTYYCDASIENNVYLADGGNLYGRATVSIADEKFTLTDKYMEKDGSADADLAIYQEAQAKISWGLPFRYVVLPVLDKGDFDFKSKSLALAEGGKVAYQNIEPTEKAATLGYGLNLVAAKAESGNSQHLDWEKPHNARLPVVYRRAAGSKDEFAVFHQSNEMSGKDSADLQIMDKYYDAFEYVVKYCSSSGNVPDNINLPPSLLAEIKTKKYETPQGEREEQDNKGYLLTLEGFNAQVHPNRDYYEQISWTAWNYNARAVGPDSMVISVQNNNIDSEQHDIVTVAKARAVNYGDVQVDAEDIKAEIESATIVRVAPAGIEAGTSGTTDGMLKVLRDYKHNYTFRLERTSGEEPITASYGDYEKSNSIKTAYREITDEELAKATMLILADIIRDSKIENETTGTGALGVGAWERAIDGATGYVDWWQNSTSRFRWKINNYQHKWLAMPSNNLTNAFITLADDNNDNNKGKKDKGSLLYLFNSDNSGLTDFGGSNSFDSSKLIPIYITGTSGLPASYSGTVEFAAKKQYIKVRVLRNGVESFSTKEFNGADANYWCPINLDGNGYLGQNSDYGWWPSQQ